MLRWAGLILLTLIYLSPLLWMVLTAFKTRDEAAPSPPTLLPEQWSTASLDTLFSSRRRRPCSAGS